MAKSTPRPGLLSEGGTVAINLSKRISLLLMVILSKFSIYSHTSFTDLCTDAKNSVKHFLIVSQFKSEEKCFHFNSIWPWLKANKKRVDCEMQSVCATVK